MSTKSRLRVLKNFCLRETNGVGLAEVVEFVTQPSTKVKGDKFIASIMEGLGYYEIEIKGLRKKLLWPSAVPLNTLYGTIYEVFSQDRSNWHYYEVPETRVRDDDVVVDCGAAEGLFALSILDRCKDVWVVEPNPYFLATLQAQFAGLGNVHVLPKALGNVPGTVSFGNLLSTGARITQNQSGMETRVEVVTIDSLFHDQHRRVDYLKADLEGMEWLMIKGSLNTIAKYKPRIAITTYHKGQKYHELVEEVLRVAPDYQWRIKGIEPYHGNPVMLHMWPREASVAI